MTHDAIFNFDFITHGFRRDQEDAAQKRDREIVEFLHGKGFEERIVTQPPVSNSGWGDSYEPTNDEIIEYRRKIKC